MTNKIILDTSIQEYSEKFGFPLEGLITQYQNGEINPTKLKLSILNYISETYDVEIRIGGKIIPKQ